MRLDEARWNRRKREPALLWGVGLTTVGPCPIAGAICEMHGLDHRKAVSMKRLGASVAVLWISAVVSALALGGAANGWLDLLNDLASSISGQRQTGYPQVAAIGQSDYEALALFRHEIRRFLAFSKELLDACGMPPVQYQALLAIKAHRGGTVTQIMVEAGKPVEYGDVLMVIE